MVRRTRSLLLATSGGALIIVGAIWGCGGSDNPAGLAQGCAINSDCNSPLVCAFGTCHEACVVDRDCPSGARCVPANDGKDSVCLFASESSCPPPERKCAAGLGCASDNQCRSTCMNGVGCKADQKCAADNFCYDTSEDAGFDASPVGMDAGPGPIDAGQDVSTTDAGPLGFVASNFDWSGNNIVSTDGGPYVDGGLSIDLAGAPVVTINSSTCNNACLPPSVGAARLADGSLADLYVMKQFTVPSNFGISLTTGTRPVIFLVDGDVDIQGFIDVSAYFYTGYAGGYGGVQSVGHGPGGGSNGASALYPNSGGGGGSYCGLGGFGYATTGSSATPGSVYGGAPIIPLVPGSAGGLYNNGGAGGGALQIISRTSILIRNAGTINAGGGGGTQGGAGSGGSVLLEAPSITINGNVAANGGGGGAPSTNGANAIVPNDQPALGAANGGGNGSAALVINGSNANDAGAGPASGGGGAGRIRFNTADGGAVITGIVSPSTATTCTTFGKLKD